MFLDLDPKMMYTKFQPYLTIFEGPKFFWANRTMKLKQAKRQSAIPGALKG